MKSTDVNDLASAARAMTRCFYGAAVAAVPLAALMYHVVYVWKFIYPEAVPFAGPFLVGWFLVMPVLFFALMVKFRNDLARVSGGQADSVTTLESGRTLMTKLFFALLLLVCLSSFGAFYFFAWQMVDGGYTALAHVKSLVAAVVAAVSLKYTIDGWRALRAG